MKKPLFGIGSRLSRRQLWWGIAWALVVGGGAWLRLVQLEMRTLHHDEATNIVIAADLWATGDYQYDPTRFHGPTLPYLSLPYLWLSSAQSFADTRELTFRLVPATCGVLVIFLTASLSGGLGRGAALVAALLCALSPSMVFYSRYYIHETPLVLFTLGLIVCGSRLLLDGSGARANLWALGAGVFLGLMHGTKETFLIASAAVVGGAAFSFISLRRRSGPVARAGIAPIASWVWIVPSAEFTSVLFYSSFGSHWPGVADSVASIARYVRLGTVEVSPHFNPWHSYLSMLLYHKVGGGPIFSEAPILLLGLVGAVACILGRGVAEEHLALGRFFTGYTFLMVSIYSAIPYKTPWCALSFLYGLIVLSGIGVIALWRLVPGIAGRVALSALLSAGLALILHQSILSNFRFYGDERNPYVYAHSLADVRRLAETIRQIVRLEEPGSVTTLIPLWPGDAELIFYLRGIPQVRFIDRVPANPAPVEILLIPKADADELEDGFDSDYHMESYQLRPNVWGNLYVRLELWKRVQSLR